MGGGTLPCNVTPGRQRTPSAVSWLGRSVEEIRVVPDIVRHVHQFIRNAFHGLCQCRIEPGLDDQRQLVVVVVGQAVTGLFNQLSKALCHGLGMFGLKYVYSFLAFSSGLLSNDAATGGYRRAVRQLKWVIGS